MPVPTTSYTDAQIRTEVIGTGGSVPSSDYTFMDLVNASDFGRFDPTYLAGATNKDGLVNADQFRNYPVGVSCPVPSLSLTYLSFDWPSSSPTYRVNVLNSSGRIFDVTAGILIDGYVNTISSGNVDFINGTFEVTKHQTSDIWIGVHFLAGGGCPQSAISYINITENESITGITFPSAPTVNTNSACGLATLTGIAPTGGTLTWTDGQTGSPISATEGTYWAWAVNINGFSKRSPMLTVVNC